MFGASDDPQVFALIWKSPVMTGACKLTLMPPVFEMVMFWAGLDVLMSRFPKSRLVGNSTILPAASPVPESEAVT